MSLSSTSETVSVIWFRRDLRLHDNTALSHALQSGFPVVPVFIFDRTILDQLESPRDRRVEFIHQALQDMQRQLTEIVSSLEVYEGTPLEVWKKLSKKYTLAAVYLNHDYEPYALKRDQEIGNWLSDQQIPLHTYKDQVIFEKSEVVKDDQKPYTVFTPYSRKWKATLRPEHLKAWPTEKYFSAFYQQSPVVLPTLAKLGFQASGLAFPDPQWRKNIIQRYQQDRDFPGKSGTSRLGVHLRFGTISIRELARATSSWSETFLNELIWRDFYHMILWHFPHVGKGKAFRPEYDLIKWRNNEIGRAHV